MSHRALGAPEGGSGVETYIWVRLWVGLYAGNDLGNVTIVQHKMQMIKNFQICMLVTDFGIFKVIKFFFSKFVVVSFATLVH